MGDAAGLQRVHERLRDVLLADEFGELLRQINRTSPRLAQLTEELSAAKLERGAPAREIAASGQLVMLTQRIGRSASAIVAGEGANAELALTLGRDINLFRDLAGALLQGSDTLRIAAAADAESRTRLQEIVKTYGELHGVAAEPPRTSNSPIRPFARSRRSCSVRACTAR